MKKWIFAGLPWLLISCLSQPDVGELVQDMVVQTSFRPETNFGGYSTYTLPLDTIGLVSNASNANAIVNNYSKLVTAAVKRNMDATGRQRVSLKQAPDLGVNVYVVNDVSIFQSVAYPGYWGSGFYGGYYGYRGFYGYPYVSTYATSRAIMVVECVDLKNLDPQTREPRVVWAAYMGDIITSIDQDVKIVEAIDQAFRQSNYLNR